MHTADFRLRVAVARAGFISNSAIPIEGIPDFVTASWQRSQSAGVTADGGDVPFCGDLDDTSRLVRCSRPVIERLSEVTADIPLSIALTDNRARVLTRLDNTDRIGFLLDKVSLAPGFDYAEEHVGTNGVGTVLESGQPVHIIGPAHFHDRFQSFACSGAPIRDPYTGRVEGVLDISCLTEHSSRLLHSVVRSAAQDIERSLLHDRGYRQQALFEAFMKAQARSRMPLFAVGGSVSMANDSARRAFEPAEQRILEQHAMYLAERGGSLREHVELPTGVVIEMKGTTVSVAGEIVGIVVDLTRITGPYSVSSGTRSPGDPDLPTRTLPHSSDHGAEKETNRDQTTSSTPTPAWRRARLEISSALARGATLLVLGEPGSGKFTILVEQFTERHPDGQVVVVDAEPSTEQTDPRRSAPTVPTLYVWRRLDSLITAESGLPEGIPAEPAGNPPEIYFAATYSTLSADNTELLASGLLAHFTHSVTIPPLRHRVDDIPALTVELLHRLAPGGNVRLSSEAQRVLCRYSWPGNTRELEHALAGALARRPVGQIETSDLPGYCFHTSRRQLSALESVERDAIVNALREARGNRVQAATSLGIARSSLYRKMKTFGIETD